MNGSDGFFAFIVPDLVPNGIPVQTLALMYGCFIDLGMHSAIH